MSRDPLQGHFCSFGIINSLAKTTKVTLQWIPAHTGISGNEMVDLLAKQGSQQQQPNSKLTYQEVKTLINNRRKTMFQQKTNGYNPSKDPMYQLNRHEQTTIFRLRTGHCGLRNHLKRIGVVPTSLCPCGEADQTPEHVLQNCSLHERERQQIWPTAADLSLHQAA